MPVMISKNKDDNASNWKAKGIRNSPIRMKSKALSRVGPPEGKFKKTTKLAANAKANTPEPIQAMAPFERCLRPNPLTKNPNRGSRGMKYAIFGNENIAVRGV